MNPSRLQVGRLELSILGLIILTALALRLWGAFAGLPHVLSVDEGHEVYRAMRLGTGEFDLDRWGKAGFYLILFVEYGVYFLVMLVTGAVSGVWDFAAHFVGDPSPFWKIGRVTTGVLSVATVVLVWWQGRRMAGPWAGLLAGWFLAFSFLHIKLSHIILTDVPMTLFTFWALVMIAEDLEGRRRLNPLLFTPVAAFAMLCKFPAIVLFGPYALAAVMRGGLWGERGLLARGTIVPAVAAVAIYAALNPGFILHLPEAARLVLGLHPEIGSSGDLNPYSEVESQPNLWRYYFRMLVTSQGVVMLLASLVGAVVALARHRRAAIVHLVFLGLFFIGIAASQTPYLYYPRYVMPLLPGLCLFAGIGIAAAVQRFAGVRPLAGLAGVALAVLLVLEPGIAAIRYDQGLMRTNTRTAAAAWVEQNIPHGSRLVIQGHEEEQSQLSIPLRNTRANIRKMIERLEKTDPGKALFWELKLKTHVEPAYDLVAVRNFEPWGTLAEYRADGVQYAVLRVQNFVSDGRPTPRAKEEWVDTRYAFYEELRRDKTVELLMSFDPADPQLTGPVIEVWRLM